jgi:hypothetical protein
MNVKFWNLRSCNLTRCRLIYCSSLTLPCQHCNHTSTYFRQSHFQPPFPCFCWWLVRFNVTHTYYIHIADSMVSLLLLSCAPYWLWKSHDLYAGSQLLQHISTIYNNNQTNLNKSNAYNWRKRFKQLCCNYWFPPKAVIPKCLNTIRRTACNMIKTRVGSVTYQTTCKAKQAGWEENSKSRVR